MNSPTIYLASDLGFTTAGRHYLAAVALPALRAAGLTVLDPWEGQEGPGQPGWRQRIGDRNIADILACHAVLAYLDGQEIDPGVASEVGYAVGRGRPVVGIRTDLRVHGERDGIVNLQLERFVAVSGGRIVGSLEAAIGVVIDLLAPPTGRDR